MLTARPRIYIHVAKLGWSPLHKMSNFSPHKCQNDISNVSNATKIKFTQNVPHFESMKQVLNTQKVKFDSKHNANRPTR